MRQRIPYGTQLNVTYVKRKNILSHIGIEGKHVNDLSTFCICSSIRKDLCSTGARWREEYDCLVMASLSPVEV
jgi:hypothetical protein